MRKQELLDEANLEEGELDWEEQLLLMKEEGDNDGLDSKPQSPGGTLSKRGRKKAMLAKTPEMMAARRRKVWQLMAKKELGKVQRAKTNNHKEVLTGCKRVATLCMKIFRQRAMQSQKNMKETVWRAKRLTREMQGYWKRYDRVERETRRRMEKEAEEQRKVRILGWMSNLTKKKHLEFILKVVDDSLKENLTIHKKWSSSELSF